MRLYTSSLAVAGALAVALPLALYRPTPAVATTHRAVTYAKDVAPILQQKCQECHQPDSIAPMSLLTYGDAVDNADAIKDKVAEPVDAAVAHRQDGRHPEIQERSQPHRRADRDDRELGRRRDAARRMRRTMPPPRTFADPNRWQLADKMGGPPDLVIRSTPYTLAAHTQDKWFRPTIETGLTEPRWVRAMEIKPVRPGDRKIVHHVLAYLIQDEPEITGLASTAHDHQNNPGLFMEWAVGKTGQIYEKDAGKLMLPGSKIRYEIHMHAIGQEYKDSQVELAIYFYPKGFVPKHRTVLTMFNVARNSDLDIPPNEKTITQNFYVLQAPARLENFQPHMHMRGTAMSLEAIYPDGRKEVLSQVKQLPVELAHQLRLRRRRRASPAQGHDARLHGLARQHRREQEQPRPEPVGRLGRPHGRRDGPQLDRRDLPRAGRIRLVGRRPQTRDAAEGHPVASRSGANRPRPTPPWNYSTTKTSASWARWPRKS